jgi:hypothetical protein
VSTKLDKINHAIYHNPKLIPTLLKDCSISKGLIYSRLRRAVPRRVGIEFECLGDPASHYKFNYDDISKSSQLSDIFKLTSFSQDRPLNSSKSDYYEYVSLICSDDHIECYNQYDCDLDSNEEDDDGCINCLDGDDSEYRTLPNVVDSQSDLFNELRVSISDYTQLSGLYDILKLFKESCYLPEGGGIHIHIDFSEYRKSRNNRLKSKRWLTKHISEVEDIFPKYNGTYNKKSVGIEQKGTYVNISRHGTIEFRIAPLTFEYGTLIEWVVKCNKLVTRLIHECHLTHNSDNSVERFKSISRYMTNSTGCNYDIGFGGGTNDYYYYYDSVVRNSDISRQLIEAANTIRNTFELSHRNEEFT